MVSLYCVHKSIRFPLYFILVELLPFKMAYGSIAMRIKLAHKAPDFSLDEVSRSPKLTKMYVCTYHMHMNEITKYNLSTKWIIFVHQSLFLVLVTHIYFWHMTHSQEQTHLFQIMQLCSVLKLYFLQYLTDAGLPHLVAIHEEGCRIRGVRLSADTHVWAFPLGEGEDSQGRSDEGERPPLEDWQPEKT